jgi:hypothetical protein
VKKIAAISILLINCLCGAYAQIEVGHHFKIKNRYYFGDSLKIQYLTQGDTIEKFLNLKCGKRFSKAALLADTAGKVKVYFWSIHQAVSFSDALNFVNAKDNPDSFFFRIKKREVLGDTHKYVSIPYAVNEIGVITVPYKFWNGKNGVSNNVITDFNAGLYVGRKWGRQRFYYDKAKNHESIAVTLAGFAGATKIDVTKDNTKDSIKFDRNSSELGISVGFVTMLSYKQFNFGLLYGWDVPLTTASKNWLYASKPWIGFGIGYKVAILSNK